MPRTLCLIRHTRVDVAKGMIYGQLDVPLADSYEQELEVILSQLPTRIDRILSSPLSRCRRLAEAVASRSGMRAEFEPLLMEMDFGHWEGRRWDELPPDEAKHWGNHWQTLPAPGGESFQDLLRRADLFKQRYLDTGEDDASVVVVSHSGLLRSLCLAVHPEYRHWEQHRAFQVPFDYGHVLSFAPEL